MLSVGGLNEGRHCVGEGEMRVVLHPAFFLSSSSSCAVVALDVGFELSL